MPCSVVPRPGVAKRTVDLCVDCCPPPHAERSKTIPRAARRMLWEELRARQTRDFARLAPAGRLVTRNFAPLTSEVRLGGSGYRKALGILTFRPQEAAVAEWQTR